MFRGGWWSLIGEDQSKGKAKIDRYLIRRVLEYARNYWGYITIVLLAIIIISLLELIPPLLFRRLIDVVIPNKDFRQLTILALGMIGIPLLSGLIGIGERYFSAKAGEGIIFDLRQEMYIGATFLLRVRRQCPRVAYIKREVVGRLRAYLRLIRATHPARSRDTSHPSS